MTDLVTKTSQLQVSDHNANKPNDDEVPDAAAVGTKPSFKPELPPELAKTSEEILKDLQSHPLFMTELDESNEQIQALQALAYEGTPLENAANFKEHGNECFRERKFADAKEYYGKGITILDGEERRRARGEPPVREPPAEDEEEREKGEIADLGAPKTPDEDYDPDAPEEVAKQRALLEQLFVNRAACHLELKNYRSCTLDCAGALRLQPRNVKALYRSAKALLALDRVEEASDACTRGLAVDESSAALQQLAREVEARHTTLLAKRSREKSALETAKRRKLLVRAALKARGIHTRSTEKPPDMEDACIQLLPNPDSPASALSFPTLLLYPAHLESDFIKALDERESLEQHFGYVFPLPWDREEVYSAAGVDCFVDTRSGGLVKVGKRVPLLKILTEADVEVVDEMLRVYVVPRARSAGWVKEHKAQMAARKVAQ